MSCYKAIFLSALLIAIVQQEVAEGRSVILNGNVALEKSVKSWTEFRDEEVVKQKYDYSCGTASLATVMKYYFMEDVSEKKILEFLLRKLEDDLESGEELQGSDFAFSFQDLRIYANTKGYKAVGLAMPLETLKDLRVPAILYVETRGYEHFTVFRGIDRRFVYLADPSFGNLKVRLERFKKSFYTRDDLRFPGKGLVLIPQNDKRKELVNRTFMRSGNNSVFIKKVLKNEIIQNTIR